MTDMIATLARHGVLNGGQPYQYGGVFDNSETSFDALVWEDERPKPTWATLEALWPDIEQEQERNQILIDLEASDADMARVCEDLIDAGGEPAQLPQAALDKINARKALRTRLAELSE